MNRITRTAYSIPELVENEYFSVEYIRFDSLKSEFVFFILYDGIPLIVIPSIAMNITKVSGDVRVDIPWSTFVNTDRLPTSKISFMIISDDTMITPELVICFWAQIRPCRGCFVRSLTYAPEYNNIKDVGIISGFLIKGSKLKNISVDYNSKNIIEYDSFMISRYVESINNANYYVSMDFRNSYNTFNIFGCINTNIANLKLEIDIEAKPDVHMLRTIYFDYTKGPVYDGNAQFKTYGWYPPTSGIEADSSCITVLSNK